MQTIILNSHSCNPAHAVINNPGFAGFGCFDYDFIASLLISFTNPAEIEHFHAPIVVITQNSFAIRHLYILAAVSYSIQASFFPLISLTLRHLSILAKYYYLSLQSLLSSRELIQIFSDYLTEVCFS